MQMALVAGVGEPGPAPEAPGRADLAWLDPGLAAADPQGELAGGRVGGLTGRPSTWSRSTPRHTEWLETRRVPLTYQEWPLRRHETRMR
jgi:hypothetical protein